jgi:hypothetical protein
VARSRSVTAISNQWVALTVGLSVDMGVLRVWVVRTWRTP